MAETKLSFLFVTWEGGGNVPPVLGLAHDLIKRGHSVQVLAEPCLEQPVQTIGGKFKAFENYFTRTDRAIDLIQDWNAKPLTIPSVDNILIRPAFHVAQETQAALKELPADIVVADFMMIGALIAAEAMGIKRVALFHMPEYLPGPGRPPGGMGLLPSHSFMGRLRDKLLTSIFHRVMNQYLPPLNAVRKEFGLPACKSIVDIYHQADLRLIQTCKAFDAPIQPAPENVRYVGPVLDDPLWANSDIKLWPENDTRPLVVVSLSSTFQNQDSVLANILRAVSTMPVRCLVTLGPAMENVSFSIPDNVMVLPAFPHSKIFPQADAVVTHAGHGTVMRALAYGLPLICMPMGRDQLDNAALVAHHGAGLKLNKKAKPSKIRHSLQRVLNDPGFTNNAQHLQAKIVNDATAESASEYLEALGAKNKS